MKRFKKAILLMAVVTMVAAVFTGCGEEVFEKSVDKLTYWAGNSASKYVTSYDDAIAIQKIQENLGVDIEFIHPSSSRWEEQFNIMIASGEYTDIIYLPNWAGYNGGLSAAYNDKVIIDLTPYYESGKMPNYRKIVDSNPGLINELKTVEGKMFTMGVIRENADMNASLGPQIRKDWLDKLNIAEPDTIKDWYNMLVAFKTQDPNGNGEADEIPLGDMSGQLYRHFVYAFGGSGTFYADKDGKIHYGPVEPAYKEFITEMNKWYNEGLIDPEFAAIAMANLNAKVTTNKVGAYVGYTGSNMSSYLTAMKNDPEFDLIGARWPRADANSTRYVARDITTLATETNGCAVSTVCKDPEAAIKVLDYFYGEEGTELLNWGVEGETFTKENGEYKFTDYVMNNPEGIPPADVLGKYAWPGTGVPNKYWLSDAYAQLQYLFPQQIEAIDKWVEGDTSLVSAHFKFNAEENERRSEIQTDTDAYRDEMITKMVIGKEPLSKFDEYVETINKYGLEELIKIYQSGYDRYISLGK